MFKIFRRPTKPVFSDELLNQLYRYALSLCNNDQQAYDLLQSCCEKVLQQARLPEPLKPYMMRVIRNQFIDQYRRRKLELVADEALQAELVKPEDHWQDMESLVIDQQHVALLIQKLSADDAELLYLWAVEGFSMQEISNASGIARGTLLSRVSRLKKRLSDEFSHLVEEVS
ncbi:RNA polymerase sigma factor [Agarivorans sp. 1_MG-2023]|uniref:RNA polymerase sigma factor n=1 Tax=Agarivorans sp. 1_MG-2023 TaxID=3062634 RepID=UPI0026E1F717|nr:RNA polymerase sigma factor [Agarivorans sp. 1_MG-2023]MDO6765589.1 RNA polymerase sigma factor [Agarivorans sp. 1_MG-2023]